MKREKERETERDVYSHNCNKLKKRNMLSATISSREFKSGGISTPSIYTSWQSGDPCHYYKS